MTMKNKIESVVIVGGGSSGWMTAAAISKQIPTIKLTLIESPNIPTIGVGESTIGQFNRFLNFLELEDSDWMSKCNATYKTSIKFTDFKNNPDEKPYSFHYPFGHYDFTDKPNGLMDWFNVTATRDDIDSSNFAEFFHDNVLMTDAGKLTKNEDHAVRGFNFKTDTAYHLDATLFGNYLRDYLCLPTGMIHILDNVVDATLTSDGSIGHIISENNGKLEADLFIDCTGFKSLLLEQKLNVPFISFGDTLLNDRAVAAVIPYVDIDKEMESVTNCTAIESGWVWNIPLWNRIGTGYVYSSQFATEEEAEEQFRQHLKSNRMICQNDTRVDEMKVRHIKIKHGVHERTWEKNVVGIGLSNGFIEPLESTGLMLTHECITKLVKVLKARDGRVTRFDVDCFNFAFRGQIKGFKDFISMHYAFSMRNSSPYWLKATEETTYSSEMMDYKYAGGTESYSLFANKTIRDNRLDPDMGGIPYIAAGMGHNPTSKVIVDNQPVDSRQLNSVEGVWNNWQEHRDEVMKKIELLPTHYEFLKSTIYGES
jgi:tryptophan halogenase